MLPDEEAVLCKILHAASNKLPLEEPGAHFRIIRLGEIVQHMICKYADDMNVSGIIDS